VATLVSGPRLKSSAHGRCGNPTVFHRSSCSPWYNDPMQEPTYDVAISFLSQDEPLALKLYEQLSENLSVFVYSKKQEQVAGTDGLETFRQAFRSQSRLVVVLYRDGWGQTPWTGVEELAIKDRMFHGGWKPLLLVTLDCHSTYPLWIPEHEVRLDYTKFANDLVGAIKLRVQELGGELREETAVGKAQRMSEIAAAQAERNSKLNSEGRGAVVVEWESLCDLVEEKIAQIAQGGPQFGLEYSRDESGFALRTTLAGMRFGLPQVYSPQRQLVLQVFSGPIFLRQELGTRMYIPGDEPKKTSEQTFHFDYDVAYGWCWRGDAKGELLTKEALSELLLKTLLDAHHKVETGETSRRSMQRPVRRPSRFNARRTPWS
jgi:TIR domain-containing protein